MLLAWVPKVNWEMVLIIGEAITSLSRQPKWDFP